MRKGEGGELRSVKAFSHCGQRQRFQGVKLCDERGAERDSLSEVGLGEGISTGQGTDNQGAPPEGGAALISGPHKPTVPSDSAPTNQIP